MDFLSIVHTIPNTWKRWLKDKNEGNGKRNWYQVLDSNQKRTQCIYQELNKDHSLLNEKVILWNMTFWQEINRDYLLKCINRIYTITNVLKLRSFQNRILTRSLITNVQLKQYGIKDSNLCTFCNSQKESTVHLLFYCPSVFNLWNRIYENFKEANINDLSVENILFNTVTDNAKLLPNLIVLVVKKYIYDTHCQEKKLSYELCNKRIESIHEVEKFIAIKNEKLRLHEIKWSMYNMNQIA